MKIRFLFIAIVSFALLLQGCGRNRGSSSTTPPTNTTVAAKEGSTDTNFLHQNNNERDEMEYATTFGQMVGMWSVSIKDKENRNANIMITRAKSYNIVLVPDPLKIRTRAQALSAVASYDAICKKALAPNRYVSYRIGVSSDTIYWTCLKASGKPGRARLSPDDVTLIKKCFDSLRVDSKRFGVLKEDIDSLVWIEEIILKAKNRSHFKRGADTISSWLFMTTVNLCDPDIHK